MSDVRDICPFDARLKGKWIWLKDGKDLTEEEIENMDYFQVSEAHIGNWKLEVVEWGREESPYFEARICSKLGEAFEHTLFSKDRYHTRLLAQIEAERTFVDWIFKEYSFIKSYFK